MANENINLSIVGVGNPSRGDDGAGLYVLDHLEILLQKKYGQNREHENRYRSERRFVFGGETSNRKTVLLEKFGDNLMDVITSWPGTGEVILIDAAKKDDKTGVFCWSAEEILNQEKDNNTFLSTFTFSTHSFSPVQIIQMAHSLDRLPKKLTLYAITGVDFSFKTGLTPAVKTAAEKLAGSIFEIISKSAVIESSIKLS